MHIILNTSFKLNHLMYIQNWMIYNFFWTVVLNNNIGKWVFKWNNFSAFQKRFYSLPFLQLLRWAQQWRMRSSIINGSIAKALRITPPHHHPKMHAVKAKWTPMVIMAVQRLWLHKTLKPIPIKPHHRIFHQILFKRDKLQTNLQTLQFKTTPQQNL